MSEQNNKMGDNGCLSLKKGNNTHSRSKGPSMWSIAESLLLVVSERRARKARENGKRFSMLLEGKRRKKRTNRSPTVFSVGCAREKFGVRWKGLQEWN